MLGTSIRNLRVLTPGIGNVMGVVHDSEWECLLPIFS